jgi:hypothetical protein
MKLSSYLFALLAFGALSTNVAAAEKPKTAVSTGTAPTTNSSPAAAQIGDAPNINGTGLIRPGSGTGAVGRPAKAAAGALSGNSVQLKHP